MTERTDVLLVGGGLANGLIARRLRMLRPDVRVLMLEAADRIGGEHTWSFHDHDLSPSERQWIAPLVCHAWPRQEVRFPKLRRILSSGYASVSSDRFREVIAADLGGDNIRVRTPVRSVEPDAVRLEDGSVIKADLVLDGRGVRHSPHLSLGRQVFVGREIRTDRPHGLTHPVIMDATVSQLDGYRFVYLLPFAPDVVLVEDTRYVNDDIAGKRDNTDDYIRASEWRVAGELRREHGNLPITLSGNLDAFWAEAGGVPRVGLAGGFFHPTTGYSLPDAVRLADLIARQPDLRSAAVFQLLKARAVKLWNEQRFYRLLNRMLFLGARPDERLDVMARFYTLPQPLIERFYAGRTTLADKARLLAGRPPIPLGRAIAAAVAMDGKRRPA